MLESALAHSAFLLKKLFFSDKKQTCVLIGGFNPSEKYEFVNWDDDYSQYMEKCSKPPTSLLIANKRYH